MVLVRIKEQSQRVRVALPKDSSPLSTAARTRYLTGRPFGTPPPADERNARLVSTRIIEKNRGLVSKLARKWYNFLAHRAWCPQAKPGVRRWLLGSHGKRSDRLLQNLRGYANRLQG